MPRLFKVKSVEDAYVTATKHVLKEGRELKDERGSMIKEVSNLFLHIQEPLDGSKQIDTFWKGEKLDKYETQFINPKNENGFVYTYGNRLRSVKRGIGSTDQISMIIDHLKKHPETRRAVATTWDRLDDPHSKEVPCMILVDFKIRNGQLNTTAVWRSHDIYGALYPNLKGLVHLACFVANGVDVPVGTITTQSISAHIYEVNWKEAEKLGRSVRKVTKGI